MRLTRLTALACAAIAATAGACSMQEQPRQVVVPPDQMTLWVDNASTRPLELWVNDAHVGAIPTGTKSEFEAGELPPLPWAAEVRLVGGRAILDVTVNAGDVASDPGGSSSRGVAARADLSCGRVDMGSGPAMIGPAPAGGAPGDCDP